MLDFEIVDPHHHLWDLSNSYPWLQGPISDRFTGDDSRIRRNYSIDEYRGDFGSLNLVGSVHVEAGAGDRVGESYRIQQIHDVAALPTVFVAGADLLEPDARRYLEKLKELPSVRGVRQILNWSPDPRFTFADRNDMIADDTWLTNFSLLASFGLSFDLQIYPHQLVQAARLAARFPDTAIVLNHAGMPLGGEPANYDRWRSGIKELASQPNASLKISGLGMMIHPWTIESIRPYVVDSIDAFGVGRSMFASNFPVDKLYSDIPSLYGAFDEITKDFSRLERQALFGHTARDVYRMPLALKPIRDGN